MFAIILKPVNKKGKTHHMNAWTVEWPCVSNMFSKVSHSKNVVKGKQNSSF